MPQHSYKYIKREKLEGKSKRQRHRLEMEKVIGTVAFKKIRG